VYAVLEPPIQLQNGTFPDKLTVVAVDEPLDMMDSVAV